MMKRRANSDDSIPMDRRANSDDSIPMDLIPEILSRLPAKSVAKFRCVSKTWKSIICRQDFTKLFHTISSSNPRLLIGVLHGPCADWSFFSSPQPQNHYGKSSLVVTADFHSKFSGGCLSYASGLLIVRKLYREVGDVHVVRAICNPSTGQYAILPPDLPDLQRKTFRTSAAHLVFDPIGKQFKVMVLKEVFEDGSLGYHILTLGTEKWREIKCPILISGINSRAICINGVLYYKTCFSFVRDYYQIGCFDVRSEKFKFLHVDPDVGGCFENLINYKGKLCGCDLEYGHDGGFPLKLRMWILEDVEEGDWSTYAYDAWNGNTLVEMHYDLKGEWSTYAYTLNAENTLVEVHYDLLIVGMTASGEIVLVQHKANRPFYVFYFNPVTNSLLSVEIQGFTGREVNCHVVFVDHVENLDDIDVMKTTTYAATSLPRDQGSTNEKTSANSVTYPDEPKMQKTDGQNIVGLDGVKLVKDIEEKVDAIQYELKQVGSTISKMEKSLSSSLPFLCIVALIGVGVGYSMQVEVPLLYVCVVALVSLFTMYCVHF